MEFMNPHSVGNKYFNSPEKLGFCLIKVIANSSIIMLSVLS